MLLKMAASILVMKRFITTVVTVSSVAGTHARIGLVAQKKMVEQHLIAQSEISILTLLDVSKRNGPRISLR